MVRHVFDTGCLAHSRGGQLDRGDDLSLSGPGTSGQRSEGGPGVYGTVSIGSVAIPAHCLGGYRNTVGNWTDVAVSSRRRCGESFLLAWNRHREADTGDSPAVPHLSA